MSYFGRIQGGKTGESPTRALTAELTMESAKIAVAQRVARLFAIGGVALSHETTAGIAAVAQPCQSQKFAATPRIGICEMTSKFNETEK